ncbi:MAG: molybdate ABC transporter substrate-binding protein [Sphingomicrobium sp.]
MTLIRTILLRAALLIALVLPQSAWAKPPVVLAAASLQESLTAAADAWVARGHQRPVISFAGSSALARQIEAGVPADLFVSADEAWMDYLAGRGLIQLSSRVSFLTNRLVLIVPRDSNLRLVIRPGFALARALGGGRLAMADPDAVPAGRYGKAALTALGVWPAVAAKIAPGENVRAALALVERGEVPAGIVYATDAAASRGMRVIGIFPPATHPAIRYPIALLTSATSADAEPFRRFLLSRPAKMIFRRFGFGTN